MKFFAIENQVGPCSKQYLWVCWSLFALPVLCNAVQLSVTGVCCIVLLDNICFQCYCCVEVSPDIIEGRSLINSTQAATSRVRFTLQKLLRHQQLNRPRPSSNSARLCAKTGSTSSNGAGSTTGVAGGTSPAWVSATAAASLLCAHQGAVLD